MTGYVGRHRRGLVPLRLIVLATLYVGAWSSFSAYATVVMSQ